MTRPIGASFKRRSANSSTRAEGASSHDVSSIATTNGPAEASASRAPWKAIEIARWSLGGGKPFKALLDDPFQEVSKSGVRELRFRLVGSTREHPIGTRPGLGKG